MQAADRTNVDLLTGSAITPTAGTVDAEDALRVTTQLFEAAVQASQVIVFSQDRDLRYTWIVNPHLGYKANEVIGRRDTDLLERAADAARLETIKHRVIETGMSERHEVPIAEPGGERWYDLTVQPQRDVSGVIIGVTCAAVDITSRKRAEATQSFLAQLGHALMIPTSPREIARVAAERIASHFDLSRCLLVHIDGGSDETGTVYYDHGAGSPPSLDVSYRLADFHDVDERHRLAAGEPVVHQVPRAVRTDEPLNQVVSSDPLAVLNIPYVSTGRWKFLISAIRDASRIWSQDEIVILRDLAGQIYSRLDRAQRNETLRAAHDTFHHLVDQSPFGIYVVDGDFRLMHVSAGAQRVFANVRPLLGRDFAEVLRLLWPEPFATDTIRIFQNTLNTGVPYHAPSTVERRRDIDAVETYDWKTERLTLPDGRYGVVCHFYDLSERQRHEAALREADRQKDEFVAMLAHELRNPLAPIRTAVGLLRMRGPADPLVRKCGDTIDRQATQMARLLDDLLDISRLSRGQLTLQREPLLLDDIIEAAVETSRPAIDHQGQQLSVTTRTPGILLDGDGARLTQVFANLLINAAKFSPAGSQISVAVRQEGPQVIVSVTDTGIGISSDMLERVFDLFAQGDVARTKGPAGLGIGLSLARRLVELHGGTISVTSAGPGCGSEFTVALPLPVSTEGVQPTHTAPAPAPPHVVECSVLVVDDNRDSADVTALLVESIGCEARVAYDAQRAIIDAERFRPTIVLLDLGLPGVDGFEVAHSIRSQPWGGEVFIVAISGWGREEDLRRSTEAGIDRHLVKPVDPDVILRMIRELVRDK